MTFAFRTELKFILLCIVSLNEVFNFSKPFLIYQIGIISIFELVLWINIDRYVALAQSCHSYYYYKVWDAWKTSLRSDHPLHFLMLIKSLKLLNTQFIWNLVYFGERKNPSKFKSSLSLLCKELNMCGLMGTMQVIKCIFLDCTSFLNNSLGKYILFLFLTNKWYGA